MSTNSDHPLVTKGDFFAALGLLTRLPVRVDMERAQSRGAAAAWAYPLVGLVVGMMMAMLGFLALTLGLNTTITAAIVLFGGVMITGAMHEDGLADTADGLWGGFTPERRLEIMKDSAIGTYGVLALILSLLIRWVALDVILAGNYWVALLAVGAISRTPMVVMMAYLPNARSSGLSASVGRPPKRTAVVAIAIAGGLALFLLGSAAIMAVFAAGGLAFILATIARVKIGGQTGDILGASQQLAEIGGLLALVVITQ